MAAPAVPRATYRLQLHAGFGFAEALAVVPYLAGLGISHLYLSPILKARTGSTHGYDIVDHTALNPELGDLAGLEALAAACRQCDMAIIVDFVPNHMGVGGADNSWWLDVLEWGEDSRFARYFDIDWLPARRELKGKLLLPFLGDHYGAVLERGELVPRFDAEEGSLSVWYWEHRFPIAPGDYAAILEPAAAALGAGPDGDALDEAVLDLRRLAGEGRSVESRRRRAAEAKAALAAAARRPAVRRAVEAALTRLAGRGGGPEAVARLHRLLERQVWRLSYWGVAADEVNYRRFFNINDLAALRMVEEPALFAHAHRLTLELVGRGLVQGVRIDHVDGLFDPAEYCRQVQAAAGEALGRSGEQPLYLLVEKILAPHEPIRRDWPVAGTTGYDFLAQVGGLFVDPEGEGRITAAYQRFTGTPSDFPRQAAEAKALIMNTQMAAELRVLTVRLGRIAASHWRSRDFTLSVLFSALRDVVACLPVYRTYVTSRRVTDTDRRYIGEAVARAKRQSRGEPAVFDFLAGVLDTSLARDGGGYGRRAVVDFAMRWQQYTGPVAAKGVEDTAYYRYNRLICLNEVGGDPQEFGTTPAAFHQAARTRGRTHPRALLATATHDTKRGEDTRLRIAMLSGLPEEWGRRLEHWGALNAPARTALPGGLCPDPADEVFVYQSLLGAWPDEGGPPAEAEFIERMAAATVKAAREAKRRTSWDEPDGAYEDGLVVFLRRITAPGPFLDEFRPFQARLARLGMLAGLSQAVLKLTCPGVPDFYQGCELWDLSLVDPDNRRPVDFERRRALLGGLAGPLPADPAAWRDGAVKQELVRRLLDLRRRHPALFAQGAYRPLTVRGGGNGPLLAFARQDSDKAVVVAVPVLPARLWPPERPLPPMAGDWRGMHVEAPRRGTGERWRNLMTGDDLVPVLRRGMPVLAGPDLFARFPLAVLEEVSRA